jgi:predicted nucleic acid-binding protein
VRFWDSSAVVPLLVEQQASAQVQKWIIADTALALWTLTPVEVASALRRLVRERLLEEAAAGRTEERLNELVTHCHVVIDIEAVKAVARRLLRTHPLRAFDALQLGAAMHWAEGRPQGRTLHTLDARLALAGQREGFLVPTY